MVGIARKLQLEDQNAVMQLVESGVGTVCKFRECERYNTRFVALEVVFSRPIQLSYRSIKSTATLHTTR